LIKRHTDLGNLLLETAQLFSFSEVVLLELVASCRNFTRSSEAASYVLPNNVSVLVNLALNPPNSKIQQSCIDCLQNLVKVQELDRAIKQAGGHDIIMLLGDTNKFIFK